MKTQFTSKFYFSILFGLFFSLNTIGQEQTVKYDLFKLWKDNKFEVFNRQLSQFSENEMKGVRFSRNIGDGIAWLKGVEFSDGIIDLDIRGKDVMQQSFVGIAFHGVNNETLDAIYFRPFNFRSTDPVRKIHAVQYISHPDYTWQVLREKHNGEYEKAVTPAPDGNDWFHAKIVVQYPKVTVFVNGNSEPSLVINKLNERKTGKVGLWVGNTSDGDFANLQITKK
jgi:hypothetical protein